MRENIGLFRGKRVDNGEWVEGYLLRSKIKGKIRYEIYAPFTEEEEKANEGHIFSSVGGIWYEVDPDTVGECTGLKAKNSKLKDKNGKLIFEGDVVKVYGKDLPHWIDDGEIREVKYDDGGYTPFSEYDSDCGEYVYARDCEIIGNIVDNPELLKGGEGE